MFRNIDTEYGSIGINKSIITQMVTDAVDVYSGKARLGNAKAVFNIFSNDESSNIDIVWDDEGIYINIFLIIKSSRATKNTEIPGSHCLPARPRSWLSIRRESCFSVPRIKSP